MIELKAGALTMTLHPEHGAAITAFYATRADGSSVDIFAPARLGAPEDPLVLSCFFMLPWCDRLSAHGVYTPDGLIPINKTLPQFAYPIHGYGWLEPWSIENQTGDTLTLTQRYHDNDGYRYTANLEISLEPHSLSMMLKVTNNAVGAMPFGLGFHPYFPRHKNTSLSFEAGAATYFDDEELPLKTDPSKHVWNRELLGSQFHKIQVEDISKAIVSNPDTGSELVLTLGPNNQVGHLWAPADEPFFCFEPLSHKVDAFSSESGAAPHYLAPGQSSDLTMRIDVYIHTK